MNPRFLLLLAPVLFILGIFAGRELFPPSPPPVTIDPPSRSDRPARKKSVVSRGPVPIPQIAGHDLAGILDLVDVRSPFATSSQLRRAFGELSFSDLANQLEALEQNHKSHPGFATVRLSLLNHLIARDPFQSLNLMLEYDDPSFRSTAVQLAMRQAVHLDREAALKLVELIENPQLKALTQGVLNEPRPDSSPEELVALLKSGNGTAQVSSHFQYQLSPWSYGSWGNYGYDPFSMPVFTYSNNNALGQLARTDLLAAENHALGLKTAAERTQALTQIATSLAQDDPDQALEWARKRDSAMDRDQALMGILNTLAAKDPVKAAGLLGEIEAHSYRNSSLNAIASQWASKDPHAAMAWVESLPPSAARMGAYSNVINQMAAKDPNEAMRHAGNVTGPQGEQLVSSVLSRWMASDFDGARNWITSQHNPAQFQQALSNVMGQWTQQDPSGAADFLSRAIAEQPGSQALHNQLAGLGNQWAARNREAAMKWALSLEDETMRSNALSGIHSQWAQSDPEDAARHLASVTESGQRSQLLSNLASNWATRDPGAVESWMETLAPDEKFTAASSALSSIQHSNPQLAAGIYDRMLAEVAADPQKMNTLNHYADDIAQQWAMHSPSEAASWASEIPDGEIQAAAYANIASHWANFDAAGAAGWIDSLPAGKPRDQATHRLVQNIRQSEPDTAFQWANSIANEETRYQSLRDAVSTWKRVNPEAAREAVNQANLPESRLESLRQQVR